MSFRIPGASLIDVDVDRVRATRPEILLEIERLGALMSDPRAGFGDEFVRLCIRLRASGERHKASALLLAKSKIDDDCASIAQVFRGGKWTPE